MEMVMGSQKERVLSMAGETRPQVKDAAQLARGDGAENGRGRGEGEDLRSESPNPSLSRPSLLPMLLIAQPHQQ